MNIEGSEFIRDIFSIFHDGEIVCASLDNGNLVMDVEIQYLAERINPSYKKFIVRLENIRDMRFKTWPRDLKSEPALITDVSAIFKPELDILEGNVKDGLFKVVCIQTSPDFDYIGGELYFQAESAQVTDEGGRHYSIDELYSLCKGYWDELSNKSRA
jgi:hypothetical protein